MNRWQQRRWQPICLDEGQFISIILFQLLLQPNQVTQCHGIVVTVVPTTMFYCYWSAGLNYDKNWSMQALKMFSITIHSLLQLS